MSTPTTTSPLRLAIPKKGRLKDGVKALFNTAGFMFEQNNSRLDYEPIYSINPEEDAFEVVKQRAKDALLNIQEDIIENVDAAIVGRNTFEEIRAKTEESGQAFNGYIAAEFNFAVCSLMIAAREDANLKNPQNLENKKIVTSYPSSLRRWLQNNGVNTDTVKIIERSGGIEDYVRVGADAICDLVQTGQSLKDNDLRPYFTVFESSAVLVENTKTQNNTQLSLIRSRLNDAGRELFPKNNNTAEQAVHQPLNTFQYA